MRRNIKILAIIITATIIALTGYALSIPQHKSLEINGYTFEVPLSDANITTINDNYKTYDDKQHNITIKSYAINNINQTNHTGAYDVGVQIGTNAGNNTTIENTTITNKSGTYTYHDIDNYQMIVITTQDYNTIQHIIKTMNKTQIKVDTTENINMTQLADNQTNNTTQTQKKATKKTTNTKQKTTKKSADTWGDSQDGDWVYGHGAGSSDDPSITWKHNKKTGYSEYYDSKTGRSWGGYNIA